MAPVWWQELIELLQGLRSEFGQLPPIGDQSISSQDSRPTRIGDNRQPWSLGARLLGQDFRHVKKIGNGIHA